MQRETAAVSVRSVYTVQPCTMSHHICRVHVCLAVTCHLHFWQNDQDHLHDNAVLLTDFVNVFLLLLLLLN